VKIALVAPPLLPIPPARYGGTERIVGVLAEHLVARGHDVTLFAPGDSTAAGRLVPTVPLSLWSSGFHPDPAVYYEQTVERVLQAGADFDVIHSHLDNRGFELAERSSVPVVSTVHGRTDIDPLASAIAAHNDVPLVAISESQRSQTRNGNWLATIYHGLPFDGVAEGTGRGGYLVFVGRLAHDKGIAETVELARLSGHRLVVAAKALSPSETEIYDSVIAPAIEEGVVEFLGEIGGADRDRLFGDALATVMLSRWPEPFGLVAIESMATGTPVIAARSGALPEIVRDGIDGFIVDSPADGAAAVAQITALDRAAIRRRTLERFSAMRMVDDYERLYERVASGVSQDSLSDAL
jgi:glycosyltransferase involved in cell wall biosynthesis